VKELNFVMQFVVNKQESDAFRLNNKQQTTKNN